MIAIAALGLAAEIVHLASNIAEIYGAKDGQTAISTIVRIASLRKQNFSLTSIDLQAEIVKKFDFSKVYIPRLSDFSVFMLTLIVMAWIG